MSVLLARLRRPKSPQYRILKLAEDTVSEAVVSRSPLSKNVNDPAHGSLRVKAPLAKVVGVQNILTRRQIAIISSQEKNSYAAFVVDIPPDSTLRESIMDTHDRKVIDILSDQKRFVVPFYQRQYKWDERLWNSFWDDVRAKAEETLTHQPKFDHYMGALILAPESYSVAVTPRLLIVDGQQRLLTFQLFLAAIREAGNELKCQDI